MSVDDRKPTIFRTAYEPKTLPDILDLWWCPACGHILTGNYNVDPLRKRCSKTWHLDMAKKRSYVAVSVANAVIAAADDPQASPDPGGVSTPKEASS